MGFIFIILVGILFYFKAKKYEMNKILWTCIGVGSFFSGIVLAGFIMVMLDPDILSRKNSMHTILIAGLSGVFNCTIAWFMLQSKINEKKW